MLACVERGREAMDDIFDDDDDDDDDELQDANSGGAPGSGAKLAVYLAAYQQAMSEVGSRFGNQRLAFTSLIGFTAVFAALQEHAAGATSALPFVVPLVVAPLGYIFFDNELMIWRIIRHVTDVVQPVLGELAGDRGVMSPAPFGSRLTSETHFALSAGRWLLFIAPIGGAFAVQDREWSPIKAFLFGADIAVTLLLLLGIAAAIAEQVNWRRRFAAKGP